MANVKSERRTNLKILIYPLGFIGSCRTKKSGILRLRRDFGFFVSENRERDLIAIRYGVLGMQRMRCQICSGSQ